MDYQISPIGRESSHTGRLFEKGDRVVSVLVRPPEGGEVVRIDVLESEAAEAELPGAAICRWVQECKPRDDSERIELEAMKLTADNLFLSLFEGETEPTLENAELKRFLGLMLERKRVLRVKKSAADFIHYIHRATKQEVAVPNVDLAPAFFIENQAKLDFIISGGESEEAPKETAKPGSE